MAGYVALQCMMKRSTSIISQPILLHKMGVFDHRTVVHAEVLQANVQIDLHILSSVEHIFHAMMVRY